MGTSKARQCLSNMDHRSIRRLGAIRNPQKNHLPTHRHNTIVYLYCMQNQPNTGLMLRPIPR